MGVANVLPQRNTWSAVLIRIFQATLCASILVAIASAANFLTTAPKFISLLFEPLSLLLIPGLLASLLVAGPHDYNPLLVFQVSLVFYIVVFYWGLNWRARRAR